MATRERRLAADPGGYSLVPAVALPLPCAHFEQPVRVGDARAITPADTVLLLLSKTAAISTILKPAEFRKHRCLHNRYRGPIHALGATGGWAFIAQF